MSSPDEPPKTPMTDAERLALAAKLDADLDNFIDGLERTRYEDGWPEDRWEEEMDKHPFFMKQAPDADAPLHPMLEGLQQLKYDPMENTTEDLAATYKEDGNFYIKHNKLHMAIFSFTEGINMKCHNDELNATLYNNRSAAQFHLKNYRWSIVDAGKACGLRPGYLKPMLRIARAHFELRKYAECVQHCDAVLAIDAKHAETLALRQDAEKRRQAQERDARKAEALARREHDQLKRLVGVLERRSVRFAEHRPGSLDRQITGDILRPHLEPLENSRVHLGEDDALVWPAVFNYPEFLYSDFHQSLDDRVTMDDVLHELLAAQMPIDERHEYRPDTVHVYYENRWTGSYHQIKRTTATISKIVAEKNFLVGGGVLSFYVVRKDSKAEEEFLKVPPISLKSS